MKFGAILIGLLLVWGVSSQSQAEPLPFEEPQEGKLALNQEKVYQLTVPIDLAESLHLFVVGEGVTNDPMDEPNVIIEKGNETWRCIKKERADVCQVNATHIQAGDTFLVKVTCTLECKYYIKAYLALEYQLELAKSVPMDFANKVAFPMSLKLPDDLGFSEVGITVTITNADQIEGGLYMYANVGRNATVPTQEKYQFKGEPIWSFGVGIFLRNTVEVNAGDTIKILLFASDKSKLMVSAYYESNNTREIRVNENIDDDCPAGSRKIYNLSLPKMDNDSYSIGIRIMKYTGNPLLKVSNQYNMEIGAANTTITLLQSATYQTFTEVLISQETRRELNITDYVYLYISSIFDSTYTIRASIKTKGYTLLYLQMPEISVLKGNNVDNYLFPYGTTMKDIDVMREFVVKTFEISGKFKFAIRLCPLTSMSDYLGCLAHSPSDVTSNPGAYAAIRGAFKRTLGITHFTFQANSRSCYNHSSEYMYCLYNLVFYRANDTNDEPVKYQVEMSSGDYEYSLQENTPSRFRQSEGNDLYYSFALGSTTSIQEVRFYITVISGDCILIGSQSKRFPKLHDDPPNDIAKEDAITYTSISSMYYLSVKCFELSLYTLTAEVKRNNATSEPLKYVVDLDEGIISKYSMNSREKSLHFYIRLSKPVPFDVSVNQIRGKVWFEVFPALYRQAQLSTKPWVSHNNRVRIDNSEDNYEAENEFIVVVHSEGEAYFTVQYSTSTTCSVNPLGRSLRLSLLTNDSTCVGFSLNRYSDLDVVFSTPGFELALNQLTINLTLGGQSKPLSTHTSKINASELQRLCPHMLENAQGNVTDCYLELTMTTTNTPVEFSLVVEYTGDETVLFDGVMHHTTTAMSASKPRHYYYELVDGSTAIAFLYGEGNTRFSIIGKLVEWRTYVKATEAVIYPSTDYEGEDRFDSYTGLSGATIMVVSEESIKKRNCSNCVLLLSVYSSERLDENVTYDLEVVQQLTIMNAGTTRLGYIEKDSRKKYIFASNNQTERVISLNTFTQGCAIINLYSANDHEGGISKKLSTSKNGMVIIPVNAHAKYYVAEVEGKDSCFYHITEVETKRRVYELLEGVFYDLEVAANEEVYFIYYNSRPESFRVAAQLNYGGVAFQALTFNQLDFHNVDQLLDKADKNFTFGGYSNDGSMKVLKNASGYCVNCYFLISAKCYSRTSMAMLVHYMDTPIPVRAGKLIHEVINAGETIQYVYHTSKNFDVAVDTTYGSLTLNAKTLAKDISTTNVAHRQLISVEHDAQKQQSNVYGNTTAYILTVKTNSFTSYTLQVVAEKDVSPMKYGVPSHVMLQPNHEECLQFRADTSSKNIFLILSADDTQDLQFEVTCSYNNSEQSCNSTANLVDLEVTEENVHIEVKAEPASYEVCMKSTRELNVSAILSHNEVKILEVAVPLLIKGNSSIKTYMSLYNPKKTSSLMVEAYECRGQVLLKASHDYLGLIRGEKSRVELNTTKSSGHIVATLQSPGQGLYFFSSTPIVPLNNLSNMVKFKYSWYEGEHPYLDFDSGDKTVKFEFLPDIVVFSVPAVISQNSRVLGYNYTLYLSNDTTVVQAASQCGLKADYSKSVTVPAANAVTVVRFEVDKRDIRKILRNNKYYYVTVACSIQASKTDDNNNDEYRIIYNTLQAPNIEEVVKPETTKAVWTAVSISVVVVGVFFLIVSVLCFKRAVHRIRRMFFGVDQLAEETEDNINPPIELKEQSGGIDVQDVPKAGTKMAQESHVIE